MKISTTAERLRTVMSERKLKQVDILNLSEPFCKEYGVQLKKNDLSQYVNGKSSPGQFKLTILSRALNVSEAWLMGYDVPAQNSESSSTNTTVPNKEKLELTSHEKQLITAYRSHPEMQPAVDTILGLAHEAKKENLA